jgi:hypothetical protein
MDEVAHERAAARPDLDHADRLEFTQGLADRRLARAVALGDARLDEPFVRLELAGDDAPDERVPDLPAQREPGQRLGLGHALLKGLDCIQALTVSRP